jgi:Uncharacterized protein conserved in bacteria (DUF2188)
MLGRHVYRVSPGQNGEWRAHKDGEPKARGSRASRDQAAQLACELAAQDEPSKVVVEEGGGTIADERLFGADTAFELERRLEGDTSSPPAGEPPSRR